MQRGAGREWTVKRASRGRQSHFSQVGGKSSHVTVPRSKVGTMAQNASDAKKNRSNIMKYRESTYLSMEIPFGRRERIRHVREEGEMRLGDPLGAGTVVST